MALAAPSVATAETAIQRARRSRKQVAVKIERLRDGIAREIREQERHVPLDVFLLAKVEDDRLNPARIRRIRRLDARVEAEAKHRARRDLAAIRRKIVDLRESLGPLDAWLQTYAVFEVCPVPGYTTIYDDFGEMVRLPKVPVHRHMGSDITAPTGSAILAPFDGYASASRSHLGGLEVRVTGSRGYVYNAHLTAWGKLGPVRAGDVVGYIGATGDATAPHDHLEWHPGGGGAVDPYLYLVLACRPV